MLIYQVDGELDLNQDGYASNVNIAGYGCLIVSNGTAYNVKMEPYGILANISIGR